MKRIFLIVITLSLSLPMIAQVNVTGKTSSDEVGIDYLLPEEDVLHPSFMGQDKNAFSKWIKEHQRYPQKAKKAGVYGRVLVSFTIDEEGRMTDVKLVRSVHPLLDKEALRVIKSAPKKWTAGTRNGKPFAFKYYMPVIFNLPDE
ncbi:MAG: energy transducer TonB [Bacteroidales bacterium]|nr:energy transducer TonB [Bacteroidales bacterium]